MVLFLIIGVVLGALGVDFALQNTQPVTVTLFAWQFESPLSLVIFGSMLVSITIALLAMVPSTIRQHLDAYAQRRELRKADATSYNTTDSQVAA